MSRVIPPVWRSRWKRSDRLCRCRNTPSATRRMARCGRFVAAELLGRRGALVCLRSHAYIVSSRKGENMGLRLKFNLVLLAVFVTGLGVTGYISYELLHKNARDEVLRNAGVMLEASLSMRQYTIGRVRPLLPYDADEFLPDGVPAFAATDVMRLPPN